MHNATRVLHALIRDEASKPQDNTCVVHLFGTQINTASVAMYTFSAAVLLQALVVVSFSSMADYGKVPLPTTVFVFDGTNVSTREQSQIVVDYFRAYWCRRKYALPDCLSFDISGRVSAGHDFRHVPRIIVCLIEFLSPNARGSSSIDHEQKE